MARRKKAAKRRARARNRFGRFMDRTAANPRKKRRRRAHARAAVMANPRKRTGGKKRSSAKRSTKRSRKRKRPGHHKHTVRRHLRKVAGRKRRVAVKRHRSHETAMANPRKRARRSRKRKRPGHHKHTVRGHYRKVRGRKRRVHVKRHRSHETATAMANPKRKKRRRRAKAREVVQANPRRRRRRRARAREEMVMAKANPRRRRRRARHAREEVIYETYSPNPKRKKRRKARKAKRAAPKRRRARARETIMANPRKRKKRRAKKRVTRRARAIRATVRGRARRSGGRTSPAKIVVVLGKPSKKRRTKKRRSGKSKKRKSKKRKSRRTPKSRRLGMEGMYANPVYGGLAGPYSYGYEDDDDGGYIYENPLSGGELGLAFVTGGLGIAIANLTDRLVAKKTAPAGVSVADAINAPPGLYRVLAQVGLTAAPLAGAYFVKQPMARAALQGFALGAGLHLVGQIIKGYIFAKALSGNSFIQGLYGSEIASANAMAAKPAAPATGTAGYPGLAGAPFGFLGDPGPFAVGVGQAFRPVNAGASPGATATIPGMTSPAGGCGPCGQSPDMTTSQALTQAFSPPATAANAMVAAQAAYNAATHATQVENCAGVVSGLPETGVAGVPEQNGASNGALGTKPRMKLHQIFPD